MSVIREWREIVRAGKTPIFYKAAAEVKAGSVTFEAKKIMQRLPACAELQRYADFGGSESGLSPLGSMFFSDPVYI